MSDQFGSGTLREWELENKLRIAGETIDTLVKERNDNHRLSNDREAQAFANWTAREARKIKEAETAERERCAKIADAVEELGLYDGAGAMIAAQIRKGE